MTTPMPPEQFAEIKEIHEADNYRTPYAKRAHEHRAAPTAAGITISTTTGDD